MNVKKIILTSCLVMLYVAIGSSGESMPGLAKAEGEGEESTADAAPAKADAAAAPAAAAPAKPDAPIEKATPLTWPNTTQVGEDDKNLIQANNKEIVQLFTQAQEVCKNMDETLAALNTQRDAANQQYRAAISGLDSLLQRVSAAKARS